jgi:hypothetical protein
MNFKFIMMMVLGDKGNISFNPETGHDGSSDVEVHTALP